MEIWMDRWKWNQWEGKGMGENDNYIYLPQNGCTRAELYFLFYSYFFHSTLLFVLKAIQSCLQHTYKIRLSLRKCKQVKNKYKEDKLQPAGWLVCGMNSVKLYTVNRDGPHIHPWVFQPPTQRGRQGRWYDFYFIWRTMKHSQENKAKWFHLRKQERKFSHVLCSAGHCGRWQMVGRSLSSSVTQWVTSRGSKKPLGYLRAQCQSKHNSYFGWRVAITIILGFGLTATNCLIESSQ